MSQEQDGYGSGQRVPQTLAEKLIARAAGREGVKPGEVVTCRVDLAMLHDSGGPRRIAPLLKRLGRPVWDPARVVLVADHFTPADNARTRAIGELTRAWAAAAGVRNFYDGEGICHVVLPERGHLRPGMFAVGGDSHSPTGGAFGCYMFGVGATDMAAVLATGETWLQVPETLRIECGGQLPAGVLAKDLILHLIARLGLGGAAYRAVEFAGSAISALGMEERMTLCNMSAEIGAQTGLIAPDDMTAQYLDSVGVDPSGAADWVADVGAVYGEVVRLDAGVVAPQVALPDSPANAAPVEEAAGTRVDRCYIGACTGAKLADLHMAARVLAGRRVATGTRLTVAPASARVAAMADSDGTFETLRDSGAELLPTGCGACAGYGGSMLEDEEVCIASTARNFKGRMGHPGSRVYLGSPLTVAASAVQGEITDPRPMLAGDPP